MDLNKKSSRWLLFSLQWLAALAGLAASLYLFIHHTRLKTGIQGNASFCSLGKYANCDIVNSSSYAEIAGIPIAAFGALYFFILLLGGIAGSLSSRNFASMQRLLAKITGLALAIDLFLFIVQISELQTFCLVCIFTYFAAAAHLLLNFLLLENRPARFFQRLRGLFFGRAGESARLDISAKLMTGLALALFGTVLCLIPNNIRIQSDAYAYVDNSLDQFYQQWKTKPELKIPVKPTDSIYGNPSAKIQIVEFSDFQCPFCQRAAFTMHTAIEPYKNRVQFIFKNYPLDSSCNSSLTRQMHPDACKLARLGICATRKGKFWDYHDRVFGLNGKREPNFEAILKSISNILTQDEAYACLRDESTEKQVIQDIELGNSMPEKVRGTPSVFINGKFVGISLTVEDLQKLIDLEDRTQTLR